MEGPMPDFYQTVPGRCAWRARASCSVIYHYANPTSRQLPRGRKALRIQDLFEGGF